MTNKRFLGLRTEVYQHPFDRKALTTLEKMPGLSLLLKKVNEYGIDRLLRLQTIGGEFRVTPRNFPKLYEAFIETCEILDMSPYPDLYLFRGLGYIFTYAIGTEKPIVGVNLEAMEWLSSDELRFVLGHELARIKGGYITYQQTAFVMPLLKNVVNTTTLGLGGLAANGLEVALYNWIVMSKFTADRAGLLACQDVDAAITALMKLSGLPEEYLSEETIDEFEAQARDFGANNLDNLDQVTKIFSFMEFRLPWSVMRTAELLKWVDSGDYETLMQNGDLPEEPKELEEKTSGSNLPKDWDFLSRW